MSKPLILIGGGGHAKSCIDVIEEEGAYTVAGIIDVAEKLHSKILNYEVTGTDDDIPALVKKGYHFLVTIGQIKSVKLRLNTWQLLQSLHANMATVISPFAHVSKYATVKEGSIIMHHAIINAGAMVGNNCIINTKAVIEHDAVVGNNCHISTGVLINGDAKIGSEVFIGSGAIISHGVSIADDVRIGAGTLIHKSIKEPGTYVGVPFTKIA